MYFFTRVEEDWNSEKLRSSPSAGLFIRLMDSGQQPEISLAADFRMNDASLDIHYFYLDPVYFWIAFLNPLPITE